MIKFKKLIVPAVLILSVLVLFASCGQKEMVVRVVDSDGNDVVDAQDLVNAIAGNVVGNIAGVDVNNAPTVAPAATAAPAAAPAQNDAAPAATEAPAAATAAPAQNDAPAATQAPANDAPAATEAPAAAPASSTPTSVGEIIALVNSSYQKSMADATGTTRTYDYTSNWNGLVNVGGNSMLGSLASTLMNQFMKENTERADFPGHDGAVANFPPATMTTCSLVESDVREATCTDDGSNYQVTLKLSPTQDNPDVSPAYGGGIVGKIGLIVNVDDITANVPSVVKVEGLKMTYFDTVVELTIDKATEHITNYHCVSPSILGFAKVSAVLVNIENIELGMQLDQRWELSY